MTQVQELLMQGNTPQGLSGMALLYSKEQRIPGSTQYQIKRYQAHAPWGAEDTGMFVYHYNASQPKENYLELRFCISGNRYCDNKVCAGCNQLPTTECMGQLKTIDVFSFHFTATFLHQFVHNV